MHSTDVRCCRCYRFTPSAATIRLSIGIDRGQTARGRRHRNLERARRVHRPIPHNSFPSFPNGNPAAENIELKSERAQFSKEGTEFLPPLRGYRLKVTDTLLAVFTGLLFIATLLLWRSSERAFKATERAFIHIDEIKTDLPPAWMGISIMCPMNINLILGFSLAVLPSNRGGKIVEGHRPKG
jgi:hypothetical protein